VKVTRGTDSVSGDYAEVDTATEQITARGTSADHLPGQRLEGRGGHLQLQDGRGGFRRVRGLCAAVPRDAADSRRVSPRLMELEGRDADHLRAGAPEYSVRASSATLEDGKILRLKNVRFQLGPIPFFWFPYLRANVEALANFEFTPGASSTWACSC
jgi:hypothetical protein